MKIDIAMIQETHWGNNGEWEQGEYTFYVTAARRNGAENKKESIQGGKGIGGVAIAIKKDIKENILQIARINERIMKIRLETNIRGGEITILNTYAPHMSYNAGEERGILEKDRRNTEGSKQKGLYHLGNRQQRTSGTRKQRQEREKQMCGKVGDAKKRKRKWN